MNEYVYLKEIIEFLEKLDPDAVVPFGFGEPMSYRGYYDELAFEPVENARIGNMLQHAKNALGKTFTGYKGGEYTMDEGTDCWIAPYGSSGGDKIGPTLLKLWGSFAQAATAAALSCDVKPLTSDLIKDLELLVAVTGKSYPERSEAVSKRLAAYRTLQSIPAADAERKDAETVDDAMVDRYANGWWIAYEKDNPFDGELELGEQERRWIKAGLIAALSQDTAAVEGGEKGAGE